MKYYFLRMRSKEQSPPIKPIKKIIWSGIGSFLGIFIIAFIEEAIARYTGQGSLFLIGSFGASAVLVYGAPLAEFSQPRNLIGGHVISAIIGVTVFYMAGGTLALACALAVSSSIVVMHLTRTLHPPGGATALIAVIGGDKVYALGYGYVISPVLVGAIVLLLVALFVNNMSSNPKRHYPLYWL